MQTKFTHFLFIEFKKEKANIICFKCVPVQKSGMKTPSYWTLDRNEINVDDDVEGVDIWNFLLIPVQQ